MVGNFNWIDVSPAGHDVLNQNNFQKAELLFRDVIDYSEFKDQDLRLAYSFLVLGKCLAQREDWKGAEPMYERATEIYQQIYGYYHENAAYAILGQARCNSQLGQHNKAVELSKRALSIYEKLRGPHHEDVANCLAYLAQHLKAMQNHKEAGEAHEKAAYTFSKVFSPLNHSVADCLFSAAKCYDEIADDKKAASLFLRALEIYKQENTQDKELLANCQYCLARSYQGLKDYIKAQSLYSQALEYFQTTGLERNCAFCTFALAICYMSCGDYRAEEYLKQSQKIYEKIFGTENIHMAYLLEAYSRLLFNTCRISEAKQLANQAHKIRESFH